jgi:hypothetical protein
MRRRLAAVLGAAAVLAGGALAAATPVSPGPGAVVALPVFSWTLPPNEQSQGLFVADSADLGPDGKLLDENLVASAAFANDERRWSPSAPLYAGQYWWQVWSSDRSTGAGLYSAPTDFTVPVSLNLFPVKTVRSTFLRLLAVRVRWTANVHALRVRARVLRRGRVAWQQSAPQINKVGFPFSTSFGWYAPRRIKPGTRLTLQVSLSSQGVTRTRVLVVQAP